MAKENKDLQTLEEQKQEVTAVEGAERTRARRVYIPHVDIYETDEAIIVLADMPGVDEKGVDITVEKNVLTIKGYLEPEQPVNYTPAYTEYEVGDYERNFTLPNEIDRDNIDATMQNGVLRLYLPKAGPAKTRKISVKAG